MDGGAIATAPLSVRLRAVQWEAEGINSYVLEVEGGTVLPPFTAGSHLDLHLADGLVRSYSLLNDPRERGRYVIAVQNDPNSRGGSRYVHDVLRPGTVLTVGAPRNSFPLHEDAPHSVLIAGGIGVTPLLSMIERLSALGRSWELHYAARTLARTGFVDRLASLAGDMPDRVRFYHDGEPGGRALDMAALVHSLPTEAHLYCCGPLPMLDAFSDAASGRPDGHVHVEYFTAREQASTAGGYEVVLARSGRRVAVAPGQTMLAALLEAGAAVSFSCSEGICGTCETVVVSGVPDHRDMVLTDDERAANKMVMICCSGSRTPELVLDL